MQRKNNVTNLIPFFMEKQILQIESIQASEVLGRLDKLENAILALCENKKSETDKNTSELITRNEVSEILRVSLVTLNDWTKKGLLPAYKCGNRVYYKRSEVTEALKKKGAVYGNQ